MLVRSFDVGGRSTLSFPAPAAHLDPPIHTGAGGWEAPPEGILCGRGGKAGEKGGDEGRKGGEKDAAGGGRGGSAWEGRMGGEGKEADREKGG